MLFLQKFGCQNTTETISLLSAGAMLTARFLCRWTNENFQ
jgi:hypothetical protein